MRTRSEARRERAEREASGREWQIEVPNDPINEQVVLAAMVVDPAVRARLVKSVPPDAFYAKPHRAVFVGLQELERQKLAYDPATVARLNPDADIRVLELLEGRPDTPPNLDFHVQRLGWDHRRATVTRGPLASLIAAVQDPREAPDKVRAIARAVGEAFAQEDGAARFLRKPAEVVHEMMQGLRRRVDGEAHYRFGIEGLDFDERGERRVRPGAAPGLVTVLTGMSGAGKSTLSAHAILGLARQRRRVLVGAWEVRAPMTLELLTTLSLGWSRSRVLDARNQVDREQAMTHEELVFFEDRAHQISRFVTFVDNPFRRGSVKSEGRVRNDDYLDILEEHVEAAGCDVALFDLFDRCLRDRRPDDEQEAVWRVLEMTNDLQIHTILVHQQLVKGDGVRADRKPSIQGLKGSSAYVDAGALIIAPHLPARFKDVPDDTMEVYGLKQRFGPPFAVEFRWDPDTGQITGGRDLPVAAGDSASSEAEAFGIPNRSAQGNNGKRRGRR